MTAAAIATIGHNSASVGEILAENPKLIFTEEGMMNSLLEDVRKEVSGLQADIATEEGRAAIRSLAYSIARRKTTFDEAGKELTESHRKAVEAVNKKRSTLKAELEAIQKDCRKPLTEWEEAEEARKDTINRTRVLFADAAAMRGDMADALGYLERVKSAELDPEVFADLLETAQAEQAAAITALEKIIADLKQAEADRAELERLRAEKAEAERAAAEAKAKEESERAERERIDAATKAAAERAAEEERQAAQAAIDAANKAAAEAQAELDRQAAEKAKAEKEQAARDADLAHRSAVMRKAKEAIMTLGLSEDQARDVVRAIVAGNVPNMTLRF